jgi:hypothetical protein
LTRGKCPRLHASKGFAGGHSLASTAPVLKVRNDSGGFEQQQDTRRKTMQSQRLSEHGDSTNSAVAMGNCF